MIWILILVAIMLGMAMPVQTGVNMQLRQYVGHPILAALGSFCAGTLSLLIYILIIRPPLPSLNVLTQIPIWGWAGGLLGATYITLVVILAPKLGSTSLVVAVVAGQMIMSLILDHYGLMGFPVHPINLLRLLGVLLLILGVVLIQRY
jgi:bacterial/archaeal transporter family-2 protein